MLLVAQRLDGIEVGRLPRGIDAEISPTAAEAAKAKIDQSTDMVAGNEGNATGTIAVMRAPSRSPITPPTAVSMMASSVNCRRMSRCGSHGFAHSDFARAFGHRNQHDVHPLPRRPRSSPHSKPQT